MKRFLVPTLIVVGAFGLWQLAPTPAVQAGPAVDQQITGPAGAPASFADMIEAVGPAVVNISVSGQAPSPGYGGERGIPVPPGADGFEDFLRRFFERQSYSATGPEQPFRGMGSGFIVDPEGLCRHE